MTNNVFSFPIPPKPLTLDDFMIQADGEKAALQGNEANPYPTGTRNHDMWDAGSKVGVRRPTILWHGILDPYGENPYSADEYEGEYHRWFEQGQQLALAVGQDKLDVIMGRLTK